jgi:predicted SnoaL-like aldol condensation-catalyzing enzyme
VDKHLERNKRNVVEFYDLVINQKDFPSARRFIGERYRQHNPLVEDGPEGLRRFIAGLRTDYPEARSEVIRVIAEGDLVVLHVRSTRTPADQRAIVEIFRLLPDGRIDEHWDVIQPIAGASANPNGMF